MTTYRVLVPVTTTYVMEVERPEGLTNQQLWESLDRDDWANGDGELSWDDVKDTWRKSYENIADQMWIDPVVPE